MARSTARHPGAAAIGAVALAALIAGCAGQTYRVNDTNAPSGSVRGVVRLGESKHSGIEAEVTRLRARGTQQLPLREPLPTFAGTELQTPNDLSHRVTADRVFVGYNHRLFPDRPFEMEWFAGAAYESLAWSLAAAPGLALSTRTSTFLPSSGVTGRWKIGGGFAAEARVRGTIGRFDGFRGELVMAYRPSEAPVRLRLGIAYDSLGFNDRSRSAQSASAPSGNARLELRSRGPFASLGFDFE